MKRSLFVHLSSSVLPARDLLILVGGQRDKEMSQAALPEPLPTTECIFTHPIGGCAHIYSAGSQALSLSHCPPGPRVSPLPGKTRHHGWTKTRELSVSTGDGGKSGPFRRPARSPMTHRRSTAATDGGWSSQILELHHPFGLATLLLSPMRRPLAFPRPDRCARPTYEADTSVPKERKLNRQPTGSGAALDAVALVNALRFGDARQADAILASCDTAAVAKTLAGWLPEACRTQGLEWPNYAWLLVDRELNA